MKTSRENLKKIQGRLHDRVSEDLSKDPEEVEDVEDDDDDDDNEKPECMACICFKSINTNNKDDICFVGNLPGFIYKNDIRVRVRCDATHESPGSRNLMIISIAQAMENARPLYGSRKGCHIIFEDFKVHNHDVFVTLKPIDDYYEWTFWYIDNFNDTRWSNMVYRIKDLKYPQLAQLVTNAKKHGYYVLNHFLDKITVKWHKCYYGGKDRIWYPITFGIKDNSEQISNIIRNESKHITEEEFMQQNSTNPYITKELSNIVYIS
jgi:hypothetical protein